MIVCFADSYYFIALLNRREEAHERANSITRTLAGRRLVTTTWVLTEVADAFSSPPLRPALLKLVENVRGNPGIELIHADEGLREAGVQLFSRRPDRSWSLTDCISFVVME